MNHKSTIKLEKKVVKELKKLKDKPNESYSEVVSKIVKHFNNERKLGKKERFLLALQQEKMTELWDNEYDEIWDTI